MARKILFESIDDYLHLAEKTLKDDRFTNRVLRMLKKLPAGSKGVLIKPFPVTIEKFQKPKYRYETWLTGHVQSMITGEILMFLAGTDGTVACKKPENIFGNP
ncbi:hypothetical protein B0S90_2859 [Caldicellulosiruptor bescii]|uniref:Uncharacterized protein n=2 Tax=Caldicellulosiruptor bescii TaxID=31899 RepID=B9MP24_CALBD|nr:hypothetical protein [Caldicellulosiruptor bescii]ACM61583.1 hypothetical protein Athe_2515 [Caldicellulosiruptor bescii DSM 6725]PBC88607.1 hypothetical protein B0S87_1632 [Caldicellulosiruptor bescii]PBC91912.1 hypothetical protein B0S89_2361 [Caldicellulosiruptor bescii]PBD02677.1 hypothetical protein B0S85_0213 [Caldicellulosiruptor bescii]PBD07707.1 hypothetical protein B0S90_2859 [Caldicellulosiruptor bescii]